MRIFDVAFAVVLILVASCGLLQQIMFKWGDRLSDRSVKLVLFLWSLFTLAVIGLVSSGVSITVLH